MIGKLFINGFLNGHMGGLLSYNMIDLGVMVFLVVLKKKDKCYYFLIYFESIVKYVEVGIIFLKEITHFICKRGFLQIPN
jgi:hypothetical protein